MAIDPAAYQRLSGLTFNSSEGDPYAALAAGRATIATPIFASAHHVRVGDNVTVQTPEGPRAYRLVGIGADYLTAKINTLFISQQNLATDFHKTEDVLFLANLAPNADRAAVRSSVEALFRDYPQFALYWSADWRASPAGSVRPGVHRALRRAPRADHPLAARPDQHPRHQRPGAHTGDRRPARHRRPRGGRCANWCWPRRSCWARSALCSAWSPKSRSVMPSPCLRPRP